MTSNVTVTLDEETARWVRVEAEIGGLVVRSPFTARPG